MSAVPKLTLDETLEAMELAAQLRAENRMAFFEPYEKQKRFCELGATRRERLLSGGNKVGKSETGAYEAACHMTGIYPSWWKGKRFTKPTKGWISGETSTVVRDVQQRKLCGEPGVLSAFGTGMVPKDLLLEKSLSRGVPDAFDTIQVRHVSGGISIARFKSYEQGRTKFQGEDLDWAWNDEEPDEEIYGEILARLLGPGIIYTTFTPMKGRSKVVLRFIDQNSPDQALVMLSLLEVAHFTEEEKQQKIAGYPKHQRDARVYGIPTQGSGSVFEFASEVIAEASIPLDRIPPFWYKLWGIDFGIDHPFGAVLIAWDKDVDCIHVLHTVRVSDALPIQHAAAMNSVAAGVPVAWPHDGHQREKGSGEELAALYKKHKLMMLHEHSTFETGGYSPEAAVKEVEERAKTGRFKVASHLADWFEEFRLYHRKEGLIVRVEDDLMSATWKTIMMKRYARQLPLGNKAPKRRRQQIADGVDADPFGFD